MPADLPDLYFRARDNGALVYRIDTGNRQRRLDLDQIATVNLRTGEVRAHGDRTLTDRDQSGIADWITRRAQVLAEREADDVLRLADQLNQTAQWAQTRATPAQVADCGERLLLAMHDLRAVLVRRMSDAIDHPAED